MAAAGTTTCAAGANTRARVKTWAKISHIADRDAAGSWHAGWHARTAGTLAAGSWHIADRDAAVYKTGGVSKTAALGHLQTCGASGASGVAAAA
jgi:hypothetical protein